MSDHTVNEPEEISLRPYVDAVWRYRRIIGAAVVATALLFGIGVLALFVRAPTERIAGLQFRLLFAGAEDNKYPNDQPFNPTEIVSPTVVAEVFRANELERYGTVQDFQQALFLLHSNLALQQLDYSYQAKLADTRLTPVDRTRLEEEFLRKREAVRNPEFTLSLRRNERFRTLPDSLLQKILSDTLSVWATQADAQKGVARPDIDMVTKDVFARAADESESLLIRIDVLRSGARRILGALQALEDVPGSRAVRTDTQRSLSDEKAVVEDIIKFDLDPLMSLARTSGGSGPERPLLLAYVSNQIVTHQLNFRAATQRAANLQNSLREYMAQRGSRVDEAAAPNASGQQAPNQPTVAPQFGDAFIDRLMEMSAASQREEQEYRRDLTAKYIAAADQAAGSDREVGYYEDLLKQLSSPTIMVPRGPELLAARFKTTLEALTQSVDRLQKLYSEISIQTMNPGRRLYTVTQPVRIQTFSSIVWTRIALGFVLVMAVALIGAVALALLHDSYRARLAAAHPPAKPDPARVEVIRR